MKTKQTLNRRDFIGLTVAGGAILTGCSNSNPLNSANTADIALVNSSVRVRYSTVAAETPSNSNHAIAKQNLDLYKCAVRIMKSLGNEDYRSWTNIAKIHYDHCSTLNLNVHRKAIFLPWHRVYLHYFENICINVLMENRIAGHETFALPFWDWSVSPVIPSIFHGSAQDKWDNDLNSVSPPVEWNFKDEGRKFGWNTKPDFGTNDTVFVLKQDFASFLHLDEGLYCTGALESVHNTVHASFSGNFREAATAALDPLFWLHHANVDWIWDRWMKIHEKEIPPPNCVECDKYSDVKKCPGETPKIKCYFCKWLNSLVGFTYTNGDIKSVSRKVSEVIKLSDLGYQYSGSQNIEFGECIKLKEIGDSIKKTFDNTKIAKVNGVIKVAVEEFDLPGSSEKIFSMQKSINAIFESKIPNDLPPSLSSLLMAIEIEKPENPEVSFRVYINPPRDNPKPSTDDKSYVCTVSFFESAGHNHGEEGSAEKDDKRRFILDITSTILKFDSFDLKSAKISICPIILNDSQGNISGELNLLSLRFSIAQYPTIDADR